MPDNDLVPRSIRPRWSRPCQMMVAGYGVSPAVVGLTVEKALMELVRELRLPSPLEYVQDVRDAVNTSDPLALERARAAFLRRAGGEELELAHDIVDAVAVRLELGRQDVANLPERELTEQVVAEALRRSTERALCGAERVAEIMRASRADSVHAVREHQQSCLDAVRYDAFARRIVAGTTRTMKAPSAVGVRLSTSELLEQPVN